MNDWRPPEPRQAYETTQNTRSTSAAGGVHTGRAWLRCTRTRAVRRRSAAPCAAVTAAVDRPRRGSGTASRSMRRSYALSTTCAIAPPEARRVAACCPQSARHCAAVPTDAPLLPSFDSMRASARRPCRRHRSRGSIRRVGCARRHTHARLVSRGRRKPGRPRCTIPSPGRRTF